MNTAELNNSSFNFLPPLSRAEDRSAAGDSNGGPLGHPATGAVSPSVSRSTMRLATSAGEH